MPIDWGAAQSPIFPAAPQLPQPQAPRQPQQPTSSPLNQSGQDLADLSSIFGGFSSGEKANRVVQGNFTQNYDRLMLDAQANRRAQEADAMAKLGQTSYILGGGSHYSPGSLSLNGKDYQLNDHGLGPQAPSQAQKDAATTLQSEMVKRVGPQGSYTPTPLDSYAKPGIGEKISSYGGAITGGLGIVDRFTGGGLSNTIRGGLSHIPGLGGLAPHAAASATPSVASGAPTAAAGGSWLASNALPLAGAAAGTYGLIKNHSKSADIGSGALAGGSTGMMIGGPIGAAIGAPIGALVGLGRHAFGGPDSIEKSGREASTGDFGQLGTSATPNQQAEATHAGWAKPDQALAFIVMRDKLIAQGQDPTAAGAQASQYMNGLWGAEKHGDQAVSSAYSPIQQMMGRNGQ